MDLSTLSPEQLQALLNGPAGVSHTGVYNLANPDNQNSLVVGLAIGSLALTTILVLLRAYSRLVIVKRAKLEDYLALAAFANFVGLIYVLISIAYKTPGWYVHQWDFRLKDTIPFGYYIHVGSNLITAVILCMKAAILLEWLRIFVPHNAHNAFFWASWVTIVANTMFYVAGIFAENFSCRPYNSIWDKTVPGSQCIDVKALFLSSAVLDLASDIAVLILPQMIIWSLQMSTQKKLGVSVLFTMGIFGCICGAFRLAAAVVYHTSSDASYTVCGVAVWALGELVALFLVFCIPVIPKAVTNIGIGTAIAASLRSWTGDKSAGTGGGSTDKNAMSSWNNVRMQDVSVQRVPSSESTEYLKEHAPAGDRILRTTRFQHTVQDVEDPEALADEQMRRQHAWVDR